MWTCLHARFRWLEHPWKDFFATASGAIGGYSPNLFGYLYFSDGKPVPPKKILDILTERVHCRWAVQIGDKTYMHDERGVSELPMKVAEYIDSTYRLMVFGLDGQEIGNRTLVFCADGREKQKSVQFPYSDQPGVYRLALRDIATGLESAVEVKVL